MCSIHFFTEDVQFNIPHPQRLSSWISNVVQGHNYELVNLNYIICSDKYLLEINRNYLQHDFLTDIITFDNSDGERSLESDIFISLDRVKDNASNLKVSFEEELHRVLIHGVLHLLGWDDKTALQKNQMREKEEACLSLLDI